MRISDWSSDVCSSICIAFPAGTTQTQATAEASAFATATRKIQGCGTANDIAANLGADVVDNDQIRIRDLPVPLQDMLLNLQVGEASPPFGPVKDGDRKSTRLDSSH